MYAINATNDGFRAINSEADLLENEIFSATLPVLTPSSEQITAKALIEYKADALNALNKADLTAIRIGEAVTLGLNSWTSTDIVAWTNYRRSLRAALSAATVGTLPTKPSYPAGT